MRYLYQAWDGSEFPTQQHLQYFSQFMEYLLEYGEGAMEALRAGGHSLARKAAADRAASRRMRFQGLVRVRAARKAQQVVEARRHRAVPVPFSRASAAVSVETPPQAPPAKQAAVHQQSPDGSSTSQCRPLR